MPMDDQAMGVKRRILAYMTAAGVPEDEAVRLVEELAVRLLVEPAPPNPMYHGIPGLVPGPVSGAPYYS